MGIIRLRTDFARYWNTGYLSVPKTSMTCTYLAVLTGFEPATFGLTGRRALQAALQDQAHWEPGGTLTH